MRTKFRVAVVAALLTAAIAPAGASAATNTIVDFGAVGTVPPGSSLNVPGCQPKGLWAIPGTVGAALADGTYFYVVTADVGSEQAPCGISLPVTVAGAADAALIQWNATLGATEYQVYRATTSPASPVLIATRTPTLVGCTSAPRCTFVDVGLPDGSGSPPAFPAGVTQAGANPDLRIGQTIGYDGTLTADADNALKTNEFHFPPGLLSNPQATTAKCKISDPSGPSLLGSLTEFGSDDEFEDTCPRGSLIGTVQTVSSVDIGPAETGAITQGDIYNGVTTGTEAGRLLIVLRPVCSAGSPVSPGPVPPRNPACTTLFLGDADKQLEKSFLTARAGITQRSDGSYGVDVETFDIKSGADEPLSQAIDVLEGAPLDRVDELPIQVQRLTQSLFGSADQGTASTADDIPFVTLPTSCGAKSLMSDATTWASDTPFSGAASFTPTGCDLIPFAPTVTGTVGGPGNVSEGDNPALSTTIRQAVGEAATKRAVVSLPPLFGSSLEALQNACASEAVFQAGQCPAGSVVGTANANSPLLRAPLNGLVFLVAVEGALPKLVVVLTGEVTVRLDGAITLDNGRLVNTFDPVPELPLTEFTLSLKGGQGGLLQNSANLCDGTGSLEGVFTGYNDKVVNVSAPLTLDAPEYCAPPTQPRARKPRVSISLTKLASGDPIVSLLVRRGANNANSALSRLRVILPKGLTIDRKQAKKLNVQASRKLRRGALTLRRKSLTVKRVPGGDSPRIRVKFRKGLLNASNRLQKKGKGTRLTFKLRAKVKGGRTFRINKRARAKS